MSKLRVATLGLTAIVMLAWAVPAFAHQSGTTVTVSAGKPTPFSFVLSTKTFKHGTVTFKIKNVGVGLPHTFKVCTSPKGGSANSCAGKVTPNILPGKSATLTVTFAKAGSYEYLCTTPAHAAAGMKGVLKVT